MTTAQDSGYAARLEIDFPEKLDRFTSFFRLIWIIPIGIVAATLAGGSSTTTIFVSESGEVISKVTNTGGGIAGSLFFATLLMIVFREKYPKWWFDFALELNRFFSRLWAYLALLTDLYPSTDEEQAVHLELDYPDVSQDLNRWLPLVKWLLLIPHYVVLAFLFIGAFFAVLFAWFAILFTGRYPQGLFNYVVGVGRWSLRVSAYGWLLITDDYPPFSLR